MNFLLSADGLSAMVLSCAFSAGMGASLYAAHTAEPAFSSLSASFVRVVINMLVVLWMAKRTKGTNTLVGDRRPSLWVWGMLGAITVSTYVASIQRIGMGEAT